MTESAYQLAILIILIGGVIILSLLGKSLLQRLRLPPLIGYLLIGVVIKSFHTWQPFLPEHAILIFDFLAKLGIIALLFGVGLQSELGKLIHKLKQASPLWLCSILVSAAAGYLVAHYLLEATFIQGLIIATAMTATSVGVPSAVWDHAGAINTEEGQLFIDVAELDDISGVVLLAMLFAILPALQQSGIHQTVLVDLFRQGLIVIGKLLLFTTACYLFARYAEKPLERFLERSEPSTDAIISVTAIGIMIAGVAGLLGFSVAIGAFFAGLAFSRDREAVMAKTPFTTLRNLFVPFFFVGIGLNIAPQVLSAALLPALTLFLAAVAGKWIGTAGPGLLLTGLTSASLIGLSMVPRAEITMIIMDRGRQLGDWAVTQTQFSAMVLVSALTCLLVPPILSYLIQNQLSPVKESENITSLIDSR